jgi:iron complex outermembrane receptor protein
VNFPRATISDGTDVMRPATLRGLGADQVLVLINGKRRHVASLVNVNASVGRGQAAVDLNAIPASMIERIEVLRDGAAAQYGSDAIAGVVNIVLKAGGPGELSTTVGQTSTTYGAYGAERDASDGGVLQAALNGGRATSPTRYFHAGAEYRDRGYTNRTLGDPRPQSFAEASSTTFRDNGTGPINHRQGDAMTEDLVGFFNGGWTAGGLELFAFGGFGRREGQSAGFFRRAQDDRTVRALWPNGFLPLIESTIYDASTFAGARAAVGPWRVELSSGFGGNSFAFDIANTNNVSLGTASPTQFDAGTLVFRQWTNNLDLSRQDEVGGRTVRTAVGAEFRVDQYRILAGEEASYVNGGVRILDQAGNPTTRIAAVGSQVFPGFTPTDATRQSRNNVAFYADVESDVTQRFLVTGAVRFENYSDFGSTTTGKLASRLTVTPGVVLRGAVNTGFRAPSLQQSFYSATATNFIGGVPFDVKTAPVASPVARALGSRDLQPETSLSLSAGVALEPLRNLSLTVDYYRIDIDDRIVLSENFVQSPQLLQLLQPLGAGGARYFTNAIDTRTNGVDVVANYALNMRTAGFLRLTAGYNHNATKATQVVPNPDQLGNQSETIFGRVERGRVEEAQPRDNVLASASYEWRRFGLVLRTQRFGEVTSRNALDINTGALTIPDQTFAAKWVSDVSASVRLARRLSLTAGADNVFDVYPDANNDPGNPRTNYAGNGNFGIFPFHQFSPFGFNGRFVYARASLGI